MEQTLGVKRGVGYGANLWSKEGVGYAANLGSKDGGRIWSKPTLGVKRG